MQQAQKLFPSLTATEIALLPLLKKVPETFLLRGAGFDALEAKKNECAKLNDDVDIAPDALRAVPQQFEMRVDGIAYGDDRTSIIPMENNSSILNPTDKEIVEYQEDVAAQIAQLIPLTLEGPRLFQMVQHQTEDALVVGVGLVKREALKQAAVTPNSQHEHILAESTALIANEGSQPYAQIFLRDALDALGSRDSERYLSFEQNTASALIENSLTYSDGGEVPFRELVQILGLTNTIPSALLSSEPFAGQLHFYGDRVLLANPQGEIIDELRLSPYCASLIRGGLRSETTESSSINPTMLAIEQNLILRTHTKLFSKIVRGEASPKEKSESLSFLEATALDVYQRHGVTLQVLGDRSIADLSENRGGFITTPLFANGTMKFGIEECAQIANTLDILGPELLAHVSVIQKAQSPEIEEEALKLDQTASVSYDREKRAITIHEAVDLPFSQLTPGAKPERSFLIALGCGVSLWEGSLSNSQKSRWKMLYRAPRQSTGEELEQLLRKASTHAELIALAAGTLRPGDSGPDLRNCVSIHGMSDAKLKFASSFALFVLANDDFAAAAKQNRVIRDMYHSVETIVEERIGARPNYSRFSKPLTEAAGGLVAQFPELLGGDAKGSLLSEISTLLTEGLNKTTKADKPSGSQEVPGQSHKRDPNEIQAVLSTIATTLFPLMTSTPRWQQFIDTLTEIVTAATDEDVFDDVLALVEQHPETENDSDEPLNDLWDALVENSLVDENW
jgi:hypothetical protein